jgi:hypothetical protein
MNKDNIIGFLLELNEMLETDKYLLPEDIYDEISKSIRRNAIIDWKTKVDEATADLSVRWLQEEVNLETCIKQWSSTFYDEYEFTEAIGKIAKIVENWKKKLTDVLYKDPSIYTMPKESHDLESGVLETHNDSLAEDSESKSEEQQENPDIEENEDIEINDKNIE